MAKRMHEVRAVPANGDGPIVVGDPIGDVRVRVDLEALGWALGPKAMKSRTKRVVLFGGAVTVEAFNLRQHPPVSGGEPNG